MLDGFIKCAAATPDVRVADCEYNKNEIIRLIDEADSLGAKLLVFPELCVTAYTCADLFFQSVLLDGAMKALGEIVEHTSGIDMLIAVGCPIRSLGKLYNCAVIINNGRVLGVVPKTNIPDNGEACERRYFAPANEDLCEIRIFGQDVPFGADLIFACRQVAEFTFAAEICEDVLALCPPSSWLAAGGATVIGNLSASCECIGRGKSHRELLSSHSARLHSGYICAGAGEGESTQDMIFGGRRMICESGIILAQSELYTTGLTVTEIDVQRLIHERLKDNCFEQCENVRRIEFDMGICETVLTRHVAINPFLPDDADELRCRCRDILAMQAHALARRVKHTNAKTLIIGISGGLDSTLALLVAAETMKLLGRPMSDIITITMPCFGTTQRTRTNAEKLCEMLGTTFRAIDIAESVKQHFRDIGHDESVRNVVYENSQARERTQILMDIANAENGMVVGTGDLSELALGWATYNGDHMSMYGVNASVPKTLVRHVTRYCADTAQSKELADVLISVIDTPVSPELLPADENGDIAQKTEDLVGPYELHDFFLYYLLRRGFSPKKIYRLARYAFKGAYDDATILRWLRIFCRRFFNQQFKRSCLPDGVKVGTVGLSPRGDWRMPSDACSALWLKELDEN